jgi:hypothetical protein
MATTTLHGKQLRDSTISIAKLDSSAQALLSSLQSNIVSILDTMSTDQERIDAINAVTAAWSQGDGDLQTLLTGLVAATKTGAGLEANGSLSVPGNANYVAAASSLKAAILALDEALKTEESARIAGDNALSTSLSNQISTVQATLQSAINTLQSTVNSNNATLQNAIDAEQTARTNADASLQQQIDTEESNRTSAVAALNSSIQAEQTARSTAVSALNTRVTALEAANSSGLSLSKLVKREIPTGAIDGTNPVFTVQFPVVEDTEDVYYNGQLLMKGGDQDYIMSGQTVTLSFNPDGTDKVFVSYFRV